MLTVTAPVTADPAAPVGLHVGTAAALTAFRDARPSAGGAVLTRDAVTVVVVGALPGLSLALAPATHDDVRHLLARLAAAGTRWAEHGGLLDRPGDEALALFAALAAELATPAGHIALEARPDGRWAYRVVAGWTDPACDAAETAWALAATAELEPYDLGVIVPGLPTLRAGARRAA